MAACVRSAPRPPAAIKDRPMATWTATGAPTTSNHSRLVCVVVATATPFSLAKIGCHHFKFHYVVYYCYVYYLLWVSMFFFLKPWKMSSRQITVTIANVSDQSNRARRDCRRSHRWVAHRGSPWCHGLANLDIDKIFISQTSCSLP